MKAITYDHFGDVDVLELRELPNPRPGRGELAVDIRAASINPVDGKFRRGELQFMSGRKFPKKVGGDFAGVVRELGPGVTGLAVGDEVIGLAAGMAGGAYAEQIVTRPELLMPKPAALSFEDAASVPVVALAALAGLRDVAKVGPGTRVLINGASGGVGTFAVQIARLLGAEVSATASGPGLELARQLGADRVIDYRVTDITTSGASFDVIFELSGRLPFAKARAALAPRGVFVNPTPTPAIIIGSALANLVRRQKHKPLMAAPNREAMQWISEQLNAGRLRPTVDRVFDLTDIHAAVRYAESGKVRGKVILRVPPATA